MTSDSSVLGQLTPDLGDVERIGRRRFILGLGAAAGATALAAVVSPGSVHAALPAGASRYVPLATGVRFADTRRPALYRFIRIADNRIRFEVAGVDGVASNAVAVVCTIAGVNWSVSNWIAAVPSLATVPESSNLNLQPNEVNANLVTVKVGSGGQIDVHSLAACDYVVDVIGYYEPVTGAVRGGRFVGLPESRRALDTRPNLVGSDSFTTVDVTTLTPPDASSVLVNLTAVQNVQSGWFTVVPWSVTATPTTSSLNLSGPNNARGAAAIVPISTIGGRRRFKIYALYPAKLVVDITGYFTSETSPLSESGLFVPLNPTRILDTRNPGQIGRLWPNWVVESTVPGVAAAGSAVVLNVTGARTRAPGHLRVSAARVPIPETSNVNWSSANVSVPNHVITPITANYGFQVFSSHGCHVVADLNGYYTGTPKVPTLPKYVNPDPPIATPNWVLRVPRIGLTSTVVEGASGAVTDAGYSWHWSGTGNLGEAAHVASFAHRTEHGGPYRNLHLLQVGDTWTLTTSDDREFTYRMVRRDLTNANPLNILQATKNHPGTTFSLIACSRSDFLPTSLAYRIVVTGELVSWREI
jgi:hypothetical protein